MCILCSPTGPIIKNSKYTNINYPFIHQGINKLTFILSIFTAIQTKYQILFCITAFIIHTRIIPSLVYRFSPSPKDY